MNQAFDAGFDFRKRPEIGNASDGAAHAVAGFVLFDDGIPRMRLNLLDADGDAALVRLDANDFRFDLLAGRKHVGRLVDAMPGNFADMKQGISAADIDESAVVGQAADFALDDVAFFEFFETALLGGGLLVFGDGAAIDDYIFVVDIELDNAAANFLLDELFHFGGIARTGAGGGHEGAYADVDAEAAFDHAGDDADDGGFFVEGLLEGIPVGDALHFAAGERVVALGIAAFDGDLELIAGLDGRAVQFREREQALALEADVEDDGVGGDRDHGAFAALDAGFGLAGVGLFIGGEKFLKRFCGLVFRGMGRRGGRSGLGDVGIWDRWIRDRGIGHDGFGGARLGL